MCYTCAGGVVGVVLRFSAVDELKLSQCWIPTEIEPRRMPKASGDVSRLRALCALLMGDKMRRISSAEALELPQCCVCAEDGRLLAQRSPRLRAVSKNEHAAA